jgi:hypothetical protein
MYVYMDTLTDIVTAKSHYSVLPAATSAATKVPHRLDEKSFAHGWSDLIVKNIGGGSSSK